jgi:membrane protein required for beta-lactamase induction
LFSHVIKGHFRGLFCLIFWFLLGGHEGARATLSHGF